MFKHFRRMYHLLEHHGCNFVDVSFINLNRRIMKKFIITLLACLATIIVACGGNDEPTMSFDKSNVLGTWTITSVQGTPAWSRITVGATLTFNADGTCETEFPMEDSYKIEGGRIKTYYDQTLEPMFVYELLGASGNTMTVRMMGTLDDSHLSTVFTMRKTSAAK